MHIAKHANTKHTSVMRLGIALVISSVWVPVFAHALVGDTMRDRPQVSQKVTPNKRTNQKNGRLRVNTTPMPAANGLEGIALGTKSRFHNFIAMLFDMEVASQPGTSTP